jgi:hypothetical protein
MWLMASETVQEPLAILDPMQPGDGCRYAAYTDTVAGVGDNHDLIRFGTPLFIASSPLLRVHRP